MERLNEVLRVLDGIAERFSEMKSTATNNCLYAYNNEHMGSELIRLAVWHEASAIMTVEGDDFCICDSFLEDGSVEEMEARND